MSLIGYGQAVDDPLFPLCQTQFHYVESGHRCGTGRLAGGSHQQFSIYRSIWFRQRHGSRRSGRQVRKQLSTTLLLGRDGVLVYNKHSFWNIASQLMRSINHSDYFTPAHSQLKAKNSRSSVNDSVTNKVTKCTPSHALGGKFSLIIVGWWRLRISDGKFAKHTTEMILWSMILSQNVNVPNSHILGHKFGQLIF